MAELLSVNGLSAGYGRAVVLSEVAFRLDEGEALAVLGRNGVGKTTLLDTLVGVTRRFTGSIALAGREVGTLAPERRATLGIGWVPQERNIFRSLTVEENMTAVAQPGPWTVAEVYEMFPRLQERRSNFGNQLSGGEQQMLAIGRALVTNPHLLILDEATEGLAPLVREEIWKCLGRLREAGQTILVIDKYIERLVRLADRHTIIERGRVAWQGTSRELDADRGLWHRYLGV